MYLVLRVAIGMIESKRLDDVSMLAEGSHVEGSRSNLRSHDYHMTITKWNNQRTLLNVCELAPFFSSHSTASDLPTNAST